MIIRISEELTMTSFKKFSKKIAKIEASGIDDIIIELSSPGGDSYAALAYAAVIRNSRLMIEVRAYGLVASAAVLVLAAGDLRNMSKEGWVMVHEDNGKLSGTVLELQKESDQLRRVENQWADLLGNLTKTQAAVWTAMHKETTYLNAAQCLALGLIDGII